MISDSNKKVHSEFPFAKRPTKNFKYEQSSMSFPVEVIEEDKAEAEHQVSVEGLSMDVNSTMRNTLANHVRTYSCLTLVSF